MAPLLALLMSTAVYAVGLATTNAVIAAPASLAAVTLATALALSVGFHFFCYFWLTLALTQNLAAGLWVSLSAEQIPLLVTEAKSMAIAVATVAYLPPVLRWLVTQRSLAWPAAILSLTMVVGAAVTQSAIAYGRNFVAPLMLLLVTITLSASMSRSVRLSLNGQLVSWVAFLLTIGTLGELATGTQTWRSAFNADKSGALNSLSEDTSLFGIPVPRIGGLLLEPTNAGYVAAIALVAYFLGKSTADSDSGRYYHPATALVLVFDLFASAAKSGVLLVLAAGTVIVISRRKSIAGWAPLAAFVGAFVGTLMYVGSQKGLAVIGQLWAAPISVVGGDSTTFHLAGLVYGIKGGLSAPLGNGLGVGGNFSRSAGESWLVWLSTGSESAWGVLAFQLGLVGLLAYLGLVCGIGARLGRQSQAMLVAWTTAAMFAEAVLGPQVAGLAVMGAALLAVGEDPTNSDTSTKIFKGSG